MLCSSRLQEPVLAPDSPYVPDPPDSFCSLGWVWATLPVLPYPMAQSLRFLPLVPSSAARSRMLFFESGTRAFLQHLASLGRHSSACCRGFGFVLDSAFPVSPALAGIFLCV